MKKSYAVTDTAEVRLPLYSSLEDPNETRASVLVVCPTARRHEKVKDTRARLGGAFRAAPLLRLLGDGDRRLIVVGQWRFSFLPESFHVEAHIEGVWSEELHWSSAPPPPHLASQLQEGVLSGRHKLPSDDAQSIVAVAAKAAAEASRDCVELVREIRYELESSLATTLRGRTTSTISALAALIELGTAVGRARDQARTAIRSGFWLHFDDEDAYQGYRRAMDPSILNHWAPATVESRHWMRVHDAGIRQCQAMEQELGDEVSVLAGLLDAASTISLAREAEAQERFNTRAAAAALGLGLPSLVLAYYSANHLLPLDRPAHWLALVPVAATGLLATLVAWNQLPGSQTHKRAAWALGIVVTLLAPIVLAGVLARWIPTN